MSKFYDETVTEPYQSRFNAWMEAMISEDCAGQNDFTDFGVVLNHMQCLKHTAITMLAIIKPSDPAVLGLDLDYLKFFANCDPVESAGLYMLCHGSVQELDDRINLAGG